MYNTDKEKQTVCNDSVTAINAHPVDLHSKATLSVIR